MRDAKTILEIIRDRGKRGLPLERLYRLLGVSPTFCNKPTLSDFTS
jgi:hypothetical protein